MVLLKCINFCKKERVKTMKKGLKLFLAVLMVVSVCASFVITASAVDVPNAYLDSSGYEVYDAINTGASKPIIRDGKFTLKIHMTSGLTVTGALVTVKYDKTVLKVVDAGPVVTKDADGNEVEVITGMHTHGVPKNDDSAYTFAFISANGFKTGTTGKEYAYITFEVISKNYPETAIKVLAGDYTSTDVIKEYTNVSTMNSCEISSFSAGNKSITLKWNAVPGAEEYIVYRKGPKDEKLTKLDSTNDITYTDSSDVIKNNTDFTYAVRAKKGSAYSWYVAKTFSYLDTVKLTVTNTTAGVKIAWDKVEGATSYRVYKRVLGETKWNEVETVERDVLTITDTSIESGTKYEYTARAYKNTSASAIAEPKVIQHVGMVSKVTLANALDGVSVKWVAVNGAEKYRIYRKVSGENSWTTLKTVDANIVSVVDTGATSGKTNYYAVRVYANGTWSAYKSYAINYLAAPKATKAYSTIGTGNTIRWNAVAGVAQYRVYRKAPGETKWTLLTKTTNTYYTDKKVTLGKNYVYTLRAENGKNLSAYNTTGWTIKYTLTTPTVSKVTTTSNSISIYWGKVSGADGYKVYRKAAGQAKWSELASVKATSFTDKNVTAGTVYTYTIRAYSGKTLSGYNTKGWAGVILKTPTVKIANSANGVKVSWSKVSGAAGYTVYSSQYNASTKKWTAWQSRGTAKATASSWVDTKAQSGTTYRYTVRAVNGLCKGSYKASASLVYLAQPKTTVANADGGVTVKWTKSAGATGYRVYRSELNAETGAWTSWKLMSTAKSNATSWVDRSAVDGTTYRYTARAISGKAASSYAATSGLMYLAVPELVSCENTEDGNILVFSQNENADSYRIYRKTLYTGWVLIETVQGSDNTTYTDKDVIAGTEYIYTVRAVNGNSVGYFDKNGISSKNTDTVE